MQPEPITTKVVSSNPADVEVYSIHYVLTYVNDLRQVGGFPPGTPISSTNKNDFHDINEILLKVALNTINLTNQKDIYVKSGIILIKSFFYSILIYLENVEQTLVAF